jgi:putative phosphoserine phosphatase/1-acylglycerol-3-phosphate O-acyltransferase
VPLKYVSPDADTKRIMKALMDLLPPESRVKYTPTEEEITTALPKGYKGELEAESKRRPGLD